MQSESEYKPSNQQQPRKSCLAQKVAFQISPNGVLCSGSFTALPSPFGDFPPLTFINQASEPFGPLQLTGASAPRPSPMGALAISGNCGNRCSSQTLMATFPRLL